MRLRAQGAGVGLNFDPGNTGMGSMWGGLSSPGLGRGARPHGVETRDCGGGPCPLGRAWMCQFRGHPSVTGADGQAPGVDCSLPPLLVLQWVPKANISQDPS